MKLTTLLALYLVSAPNFSRAETYTPQEREALAKFRPMVQDVLYQDWMKKDEFLVKWIRDRSFNLDRANQKLRKAIEWRKQNNIDNLLKDTSLEEMKQELPYKIISSGKIGNPIVVYRLGQDWDFRKLALAGKVKQANRHLQGMCEAAYTQVRALDGNVTQSFFIASLLNYNLRQHACLACIPIYTDWVVTLESYYPETLKSIMGINNPRIFEPIVNLVRPLMSPGTRAGFKLFGYDKAAHREWMTSLGIDLNYVEQQFNGYKPNEN